MNNVKLVIQKECELRVIEKISLLEKSIEDLNHSIANDTKSSSGDKFETSREMAQQEITKLQVQLVEWNKQKQQLKSLQEVNSGPAIVAGSLVVCDNFYIYISVGIGKIDVDHKTCWCISPVSPLAQVLLGKTVNQTFAFNGTTLTIKQVV